MITGYTRPLFKGDDTAGDAAELRTAGIRKIAAERDWHSRDVLGSTLAATQSGDTLTVTSLERLGTSVTQVINALLELRARDVNFVCLATPVFNTARDQGDITTALRALNAVHRSVVSRRTKAGLVGRPVGRPPVLTPEDIAIATELRRNGRSFARIARALGVSATSVHRALNSRESGRADQDS